LDRAIRIHSFQPHRVAEQEAALSSIVDASPSPLRQIVGRKLGRFFILSHQDIFFFRVDDSIVKAHTVAEAYSVNYQINYLDSCLPEDAFFRAHRSAIVNLPKVKEVQPYGRTSFLLLMSDRAQTEIKVSERQAALLRRRLPGL
ncbi:MAG TPA: LytTR family DNA-binding domain-containing protein, partial [Blastocatellia bacterium]|nr:LytTR family DNA-binding domain-containing protein [Blastocatellia bacterium]